MLSASFSVSLHCEETGVAVPKYCNATETMVSFGANNSTESTLRTISRISIRIHPRIESITLESSNANGRGIQQYVQCLL